MSTRIVHRPARTVRPLAEQEPVLLTPPPTLPDGRSGGGLQSIIPLAGAGAAMSMMMFLRGSQFAALGAVIMLVSLSAAAVFFFSQRGQAGRKRRTASERYLDYLEDLREELRDSEAWLQSASKRPDPPPAALLSVVQDPARLWERRRADPDFLRVRLGTGALPVRPFELRDEGSLSAPTDPFMLSEGRSLVRRFRLVPGLPLRVNLDRAGDVAVVGAERAEVLTVARAILAQVTALHAPDDVTVAVITGDHDDDWSWVRWLPHAVPGTVTVDGPAPLLFRDTTELLQAMGNSLQERAGRAATSTRHGGGDREARTQPRLVVLDDCYGQVARTIPVPDQAVDLGAMAVTVVHLLADRLQEPGEISQRVTVIGEEVTVQAIGVGQVDVVRGTLDDAPAALIEGLARELSPMRLSADSFDDGSGLPAADFADLLGIPEPTRVDLRQLWAPRSERDFLRVPLGLDDHGKPVLLDLKESAQLGMGPHGLCVGATGSGKSELLRTMVMALALTHPPEQLAFVLADYKGGAAFAPFASLPHLAGLITNLSGDAALVERMYSSLEGEVRRRQEVLAAAGKVPDITEYNLRRAADGGRTMAPLRHVVVVIDEFGELLTAKPEFIELFLQIGRIGRSIGMHLLLSSQRVEQGKLRGLDTYLSYRIGLRTLSEQESRTVLETPDAFHLPALPGNAYLKVDVTIYDRFRAAFVSGPLEAATATAMEPQGPLVKPMLSSAHRAGGQVTAAPLQSSPRTTGPTLLGTVLDQVVGNPVSPVWLPPLPERISLDAVAGGMILGPHGPALADLDDTAGRGLVAPIGVLDDPGRQWQGPWLVDLSEGGGNLLVLGGPGSGKSTTLRTLALGLALTQRPSDVGIYGVDLLGSGLRVLDRLPHVGGVAGRDDLERVRRTFDEVHAMLLVRERIFARLQLDSVADLRVARAAGQVDELGSTEIVLLIDGYGQVLAEFEHLEAPLFDLLGRGARFGIHVVATARRWNEPRAAQQVAFSRRVELRLTEPAESSIDPKLARTVPTGRPGRALSSDQLVGQVALPRIDGVADDPVGGLVAAATMIDSAWTGRLPHPVRVLPAVLPLPDLADGDTPAPLIPLGRVESDFTTARLDLFGNDQHLLVLGDSQTGKTNLLRVVATELARRYSADDLVFAVFDPRQTLTEDLLGDDYQGGYASNASMAERLAASVAGELGKRDSHGRIDGKPQPRVVLLVDDYDVLTAGTRPLSVLSPFLASGRDIGVHVVMSRRVSGASRGLFEPFTLAVRESGCLSVMLSGDRSEGQLFTGVRPTTMPPGRAFLVAPGAATRTIQTAWWGTPEQDR